MRQKKFFKNSKAAVVPLMIFLVIAVVVIAGIAYVYS